MTAELLEMWAQTIESVGDRSERYIALLFKETAETFVKNAALTDDIKNINDAVEHYTQASSLFCKKDIANIDAQNCRVEVRGALLGGCGDVLFRWLILKLSTSVSILVRPRSVFSNIIRQLHQPSLLCVSRSSRK